MELTFSKNALWVELPGGVGSWEWHPSLGVPSEGDALTCRNKTVMRMMRMHTCTSKPLRSNNEKKRHLFCYQFRMLMGFMFHLENKTTKLQRTSCAFRQFLLFCVDTFKKFSQLIRMPLVEDFLPCSVKLRGLCCMRSDCINSAVCLHFPELLQ